MVTHTPSPLWQYMLVCLLYLTFMSLPKPRSISWQQLCWGAQCCKHGLPQEVFEVSWQASCKRWWRVQHQGELLIHTNHAWVISNLHLWSEGHNIPGRLIAMNGNLHTYHVCRRSWSHVCHQLLNSSCTTEMAYIASNHGWRKFLMRNDWICPQLTTPSNSAKMALL